MTPTKLQFFVDGEWRDTESSEYMPVTNSSTGEVMAEAPKCTAAEVNEAVAAAGAAYPAWRDTPLPARVQVMFQFKQLVEARARRARRSARERDGQEPGRGARRRAEGD